MNWGKVVGVEKLPDDVLGAVWVEIYKSGKYKYKRRRCRVLVGNSGGKKKTRKKFLKYLGKYHDTKRGGGGES